MSRKRSACGAAMLLSLAGLWGCAALPGTTTAPVIARIQNSGELRVGMTGDYPPLNALDREGQNFGLEPELAQFLARAMGVRVRFVNRPFAELIGAIEAGEVDVVLSGMTMSPERNERVAFAGPYFVSGTSVLTRTPALAEARTARDLDQPSLTLTALEGSTSETLIKDSMPRARFVPAKDHDSAVQSVIDGTADGLITDYPICIVHAARRRDAGLLVRGEPFTFEPIGIALPPNDPLFVNLVQNYLASLEKTGILSALRERWFKDASWARRLP